MPKSPLKLTRLDDLLFLIASSSLAIACPADDSAGDDASDSVGTSHADTTHDGPTGTAGVDATDTSSPTTTASPTTGDAMSTTDATSGETGDGSDTGSGGGLSPARVCPAFGATQARCAPGVGNDYQALCYDLVDYYDTTGLPLCADALLELYACISALDCAGVTAGSEVSCPSEHDAFEAECPAMPPPP